jgi:hypothetical protein
VIPLLSTGRLAVEDLTTSVVPLAESLKAIQSLRPGSVMKLQITPNAS